MEDMWNRESFVFLGGHGSARQILITEFEELDFDHFSRSTIEEFIEYPLRLSQRFEYGKSAQESSSLEKTDEKALSEKAPSEAARNLEGAIFGLTSYDQSAGFFESSPSSQSSQSSQSMQLTGSSHLRHRIFRAKSGILATGDNLEYFGPEQKASPKVFRPTHDLRLDLVPSQVSPRMMEERQNQVLRKQEPFWDEKSAREQYLKTATRVKEDIASGAYYQLNLLRFFEVTGLENEKDLLTLFWKNASEQSCLFKLHDELVVSFSPERFVDFSPLEKGENGDLRIKTWPIKGTRPRGGSEKDDERLRAELAASVKDNAELNMIVDLMRNDLRRLCRGGSVRVFQAPSPVSFPTVHHLVAGVEGVFSAKTYWQDFFRCLFPAGSITGAPKKTVMEHIARYEKRQRGRFMANAFLMTRNGRFDSSVLIRTLTKDQRIGSGKLLYAAGSGIVHFSDPEEEYEEILTKCRVLSIGK